MKIYNKLSSIGFLNKYSYKFLFVAFIGIHIPLIGMIIFIITSQGDNLSPLAIILISLALTLLATGVTLYFLNLLLAPLIKSKTALENYVDNGILPSLPQSYTDEAGILMQKLQFTIFKLDELVKAKDDLISLISHDVRAPLSHIINYAELAKLSSSNEKVSSYTDKIIVSGNQQLKMLESILSMLEQQGVNLSESDKELINSKELIQQNLSNVESIINDKNLTIDVKCSDNLLIKINASLFNHVLYNLISNACKFSPENGLIEIKCSQHNPSSIQIEIKDNGIGFDPINEKTIFDRFTKFGQIGTKGESSTGLGLYVSKRIVEKHGGKITAKSEGKNKGAIFLIEIPN